MFSTDNAVLKTSMPALCVYENLVYVLHILKIKVFTMCPINSPQILISHYATPVPMQKTEKSSLFEVQPALTGLSSIVGTLPSPGGKTAATSKHQHICVVVLPLFLAEPFHF